jgi:hypothetical protein
MYGRTRVCALIRADTWVRYKKLSFDCDSV